MKRINKLDFSMVYSNCEVQSHLTPNACSLYIFGRYDLTHTFFSDLPH